MKSHWENIADCLRQELADYGGLLHLFEQQQQALFARDANGVLGHVSAIEEQVLAIADCRARREAAVAAFAVAHGQPAAATLRSLLPMVAAEARPLLEALASEVNRLIHRVRQTSRQNHLLLARTIEMNQETLQLLSPGSFSKTDSPAGRISVGMAPSASGLCVAG
jgi:flagellar biosynthesis/type III secretory pathway chaperone